jgi:uncharacterized membrane protein
VTYVPGSVAADADVTFGNVFERSFSILGRNLVPLLILGGIAALPYLLIYYFQGDPLAVKPVKPSFSMATAIIFFVSLIAAFALRPISQAIILFGAFQDMRGLRFPIGESLRKGLARFFPIFGMLVIEGLGLLAGFILLFVPGYMLYTAWYVALPVLVVERLGPVASLRRSAALTKGHRWKIFGIIFVMGLVAGVLGAIVSGIVVASHNRMVFVGVQYLFQTVYIAFQSVVGVVLYHDLRVAKEGLDTDRIAAVFD